MSFKAIWNNRNRPRKCSGNDCVCSTTSGHGIPRDMVEYGSFRMIPDRKRGQYEILGHRHWHLIHIDPPEYGKIMTKEEADQLDIETGRAVPYTRNCLRFVMSRAARRRGIAATDPLYLRRAAQGRPQ